MLPLSSIPPNYNQNPLQQYFQQILATRKQQGAGGMPTAPMPQGQQPNGQQPQQQGGNPMAGIQAISQLMGYKPNTTFGYDMNNAAPQQGPTQGGSPIANPSMNLSDAINHQGILSFLGNMFGGG